MRNHVVQVQHKLVLVRSIKIMLLILSVRYMIRCCHNFPTNLPETFVFSLDVSAFNERICLVFLFFWIVRDLLLYLGGKVLTVHGELHFAASYCRRII